LFDDVTETITPSAISIITINQYGTHSAKVGMDQVNDGHTEPYYKRRGTKIA
jgi:hypothetical protein